MLKKLLLTFIAFFLMAGLALGASATDDGAHRIWYASSLTGGGEGSLDGSVSGNSIGQYDAAIVVTDFRVYFYSAVISDMPENSPQVINPDINSGLTRWHLSYQTGSGETVYCIISSPDLLDNPNAIPLFVNDSGVSFIITNLKLKSSDSGSSVEGIEYTASETNFRFGSGTTMFNFTDISTAGTDMYYTDFYKSGGVTIVPNGRTIMMDYSDIATDDWIIVEFGGYFAEAQ